MAEFVGRQLNLPVDAEETNDFTSSYLQSLSVKVNFVSNV